MKKSLVFADIEILNLISNKNLGITQINKQTGLYKEKGFEIVNKLEKGNLVKREKDSLHSQRKFIRPTTLGEEVISLLEMGQEYIEKNFNLIKIMENSILFLTDEDPDVYWNDDRLKEIYDYAKAENKVIRKSILERKLKKLGWGNEEIVYYQESINKALQLKEIFDRNFFYIILFRILRFKVNFLINKDAQTVIVKVITRLMEVKISTIRELFDSEIAGYFGRLRPVSESYHYEVRNYPQRGGVFTLLYEVMNIFVYPLPFVIKSEIEDIVTVYLKLVKPLLPRGMVMRIINEFAQEIGEQKQELEGISRLTSEKLRMYRIKNEGPTDRFYTRKNSLDTLKLRIRSMELFLSIMRKVFFAGRETKIKFKFRI